MEPGHLEERVTALETQVGDLDRRVRASEHDATAARVLAGAADRDVADLGGELRDFRRATVTSFNALREDMNDRFSQVATSFTEIFGKLDTVAAGQQQIVELIQGLTDERGESGSSEHP